MTKALDDVRTVVIDSGSSTCRAGFAGDEVPTAVFPSVVGRHRHHICMKGLGRKQFYQGEEALRTSDDLSLVYPVQQGVVAHWEEMERVWYHVFYDLLLASPEDHPVLLTDSPLSPRPLRENMTQVMFETFLCPALSIASQAQLSLYASGRTTGIVLDVGDTVSHAVPYWEGRPVSEAVTRGDIAGHNVTVYLQQHLAQQTDDFQLALYQKEIADLKEKLCYVAMHYGQELEKYTHTPNTGHQYRLPDGRVITVGNERFQAPEVLFQPSFCGRDHLGIHETLYQTIKSCDPDIQSDLYTNIVLTGGSTLLTGFPERLSKELRARVPASVTVKVIAPPERKQSAWIGGSILGSLSTFKQLCISKEEYDEIGPSVAKKLCL